MSPAYFAGHPCGRKEICETSGTRGRHRARGGGAGAARAHPLSRGGYSFARRAVFMPSLVARTFGVPWAAGSGQLVAAQTLSWAGDLALMRRDRAPFLVG